MIKPIKHKFSISVDSGSIMALLTSIPHKESFPVPQGNYKITLRAKDTWNGPQSSSNFLVVKTPMFLSIDDGFYRDEENGEDPVLNHQVYKKGCVLSTGGDGDFSVVVELKRVSSIGPDPYKMLLKKAKVFLKGKKFSEDLAKKFVEKFLSGVYYESVNDILSYKRHKESTKELKKLERLLGKIK